MKKRFTITLFLVNALIFGGIKAETNDIQQATADRLEDQLVVAWRTKDTEKTDGIPMENLSFPIDHFEDGSVRAQFRSKFVLLPNDENAFVRAEGMQIELYDEQGAVMGYYIADNCIFDRATRTGYCEGPVRVYFKAPDQTIRLEGTNMQWNLASRDAKILISPKVTMAGIFNELGEAFR